MAKLNAWCDATASKVSNHDLLVLKARPAKSVAAIAWVAATVPTHYASKQRLANLLGRLGKAAAASYIKDKLPLSKKGRSGDLGEILATNYVAEFTDYDKAIIRLRWKDHREMAMRGEDIIAIKIESGASAPKFLKGEVKSNQKLTAATVSAARSALEQNSGLPSPHGLAFVADRLHEEGRDDIADVIDDAQLGRGIRPAQVSHLVFVLTGNDPTNLLRKDLTAYSGPVPQESVGLWVEKHQDFIRSVYEQVIKDA